MRIVLAKNTENWHYIKHINIQYYHIKNFIKKKTYYYIDF